MAPPRGICVGGIYISPSHIISPDVSPHRKAKSEKGFGRTNLCAFGVPGYNKPLVAIIAEGLKLVDVNRIFKLLLDNLVG